MQNPFNESPLQQIIDPLLQQKGVELFIKRDDLIHAHIQGNKWRKLKYNLLEARLNGYHTLLTFGGPYSNHIYATAAAAKLFHFKAIGIIRGNEASIQTSTLQYAASQGMQLHYMDRECYKQKDNPENIESLRILLGDFYYVPEGGTNQYALEGVAEVVSELDIEYDYMCTACGTGGTLAGLVSALKGSKRLIGFSSLKGDDTLTSRVNELVLDSNGEVYNNFRIMFDYHFGGYAKVNGTLIDFIKRFKKQHNIQLEPVYTAKMLYGLYDMIQQDYFEPGARIIAIHTGGLQGLCGYTKYFAEQN